MTPNDMILLWGVSVSALLATGFWFACMKPALDDQAKRRERIERRRKKLEEDKAKREGVAQ